MQCPSNVPRMTDRILSRATWKKSGQKLHNMLLSLLSKNTLPALIVMFYKETESVLLYFFVDVLVGSIKIWSINKKMQTLPRLDNSAMTR